MAVTDAWFTSLHVDFVQLPFSSAQETGQGLELEAGQDHGHQTSCVSGAHGRRAHVTFSVWATDAQRWVPALTSGCGSGKSTAGFYSAVLQVSV